MKSLIISTFIIILSLATAFASDLKLPKEIKKAYTNQTRSYDGKPGSSYW